LREINPALNREKLTGPRLAGVSRGMNSRPAKVD
jgi:hypothetical protein